MSFSFSAAGTKAETLSSLSTPQASPDGEAVRQLVISFLENAAEAGATDNVPIRYEVSAYGHHSADGGSLPSLSVTLSGTYVPATPAESPGE